jgi:hypothetical protein
LAAPLKIGRRRLSRNFDIFVAMVHELKLQLIVMVYPTRYIHEKPEGEGSNSTANII